MLTYFKRGTLNRNGNKKRVVFLAKADLCITHRGQNFYIDFQGERAEITHGPSGGSCRSVRIERYDRMSDIEYRIRKHLDEKWPKILESAKKREKCAWRW